MQLRRSVLTSVYLYLSHVLSPYSRLIWGMFSWCPVCGGMGGTCDIAGRNRLDEDMGNRDWVSTL